MFLWHIGGLQRKTTVFKGQRLNSVLCYRRLPFFLTRPRTALTPSLQTRPCNHCIHRNLTGPIAVKSSFIFRRPCSQCLIPQPLVSTWWNPMTVHEGPEWRVYISQEQLDLSDWSLTCNSFGPGPFPNWNLSRAFFFLNSSTHHQTKLSQKKYTQFNNLPPQCRTCACLVEQPYCTHRN